MKVSYKLLDVDKPMFGSIIFPTEVVQDAISKVRGSLDLCRYECWVCGEELLDYDDAINDTRVRDEMISRLSSSGRLLEVVGRINGLWLENKTLCCYGEMDKGIRWPLPLADYIAVPYVELKAELFSGGDVRRVKDLSFTEIVLVYQHITKLAVQKYRLNRSRALMLR